ncbi:hypothetical protein ABH926_001248 [Catenulispora sp. GP43]|uniref:hypothetical protein n=1 Tax=Catenulispora sp. GP43 TaxID=3156263 RepID=UPI00351903CD
MALTSRQKKQGALATVAVGTLALGGIALSTLGPTASPADSKPVAAAAVPQPAAAPAAPQSPAAAAATIAVTAQADNTKPGDDTVFTVSGVVTGAQPGTKIRLQQQKQSTSRSASSAWTTLAYTTFTDKDDKFSLPVKMETAGSFNLRVLHPQDKEGPHTAYSMPFSVTVSSTTTPATTSAKKG